MHFEADPKLFKQISQQLFARDLLPFPRPINGEEEHKVPLFFAEKNEMPSGILIIKPFSTVLLITLFKTNEVPMNQESSNRYFTST